MVGFSISSWRNRFPPFDTLSCSVIIYCVNLEICDFYIFFFTGIGYTSKKGELILSKKTPQKQKTTKWCDISTAQKRYGCLLYYLRYIWRNEFKRTIVVTFSLGRKYMKRKEIECRFFVKKKTHHHLYVYVCMSHPINL